MYFTLFGFVHLIVLDDAFQELPVNWVAKAGFEMFHHRGSKVVMFQRLFGESKDMTRSDLKSSIEVPVGRIMVAFDHVSKSVKSGGVK